MSQEPIDQGIYSTIKGWVEKLDKSQLLAQLKIQAKNVDIDKREDFEFSLLKVAQEIKNRETRELFYELMVSLPSLWEKENPDKGLVKKFWKHYQEGRSREAGEICVSLLCQGLDYIGNFEVEAGVLAPLRVNNKSGLVHYSEDSLSFLDLDLNVLERIHLPMAAKILNILPPAEKYEMPDEDKTAQVEKNLLILASDKAGKRRIISYHLEEKRFTDSPVQGNHGIHEAINLTRFQGYLLLISEKEVFFYDEGISNWQKWFKPESNITCFQLISDTFWLGLRNGYLYIFKDIKKVGLRERIKCPGEGIASIDSSERFVVIASGSCLLVTDFTGKSMSRPIQTGSKILQSLILSENVVATHLANGMLVGWEIKKATPSWQFQLGDIYHYLFRVGTWLFLVNRTGMTLVFEIPDMQDMFKALEKHGIYQAKQAIDRGLEEPVEYISEFIGHEELLLEIKNVGNVHYLISGAARMGKTSLLKILPDVLSENSRCCYIDIAQLIPKVKNFKEFEIVFFTTCLAQYTFDMSTLKLEKETEQNVLLQLVAKIRGKKRFCIFCLDNFIIPNRFSPDCQEKFKRFLDNIIIQDNTRLILTCHERDVQEINNFLNEIKLSSTSFKEVKHLDLPLLQEENINKAFRKKYQLNEKQLREIFRYSGGIPFHIRLYQKWKPEESTIEEYSKTIAVRYSREIFEFFRDLNRETYLYLAFFLVQELIGGEIGFKSFYNTYPLLNEILPKSRLENVLDELNEYTTIFYQERDEENFSIKMQDDVLLLLEAIKNLSWIRLWTEMLKFSKDSNKENAEKAVTAYGELIGFKLESDDLTKKVSEQFREFYIARINADGREALGMRLETFIVIPLKPWETGKSSPEFLQFYISLQEVFRIHLKSIHEGASIPKFYLIFAEFHGGKKEFIKNELKDLERVPILDVIVMKDIILSPNPKEASKDYIFRQLNISERSPYITAGAVQDLFYGRNLEIALIRGLPENIGIFGTRTIGKTSLLLKLYREIKMNTSWKPYVIDCARIDSEESLLKNLAQKMQIDFSSISDIEKFREYILREAENHNTQYLFLLDEVDRLVKYDADHGQRIFNTFNQMCTESLASGGKAARFLLCGFYEMYKQMSDHESRLYNFMVFLPLKPLDKKSALTLVTKPMQDIYVHWENETDAHYLVERCSGHPLLLQTACQALLSTLDRKTSSKDTIEKKDVDEALMAQEFRNICLRFYRPTSDEEVKKKKAWIKHRETTDMRQSLLENIHRIILLSTAISRSKEKKESFTLAAIQADLKKYGITISPEDLRNTLDYLCLCGVFRLQNEPTLLTTHVDKVREAMADELNKIKQENLQTFEITGIEKPDFYSPINGTFLSFSYEFAVQIFPDLLVADLGGRDKCEEELKNLIKLKNKEKKVGDSQSPGGFKNEPGIFKPSIE